MIAVVKNLVDNAIRYTPDGGKIDLSFATEEEYATLKIRDPGPGIPVAKRERVFNPFYRMHGSEQVGSVLGLSIVKAVADRIGAQIRLEFSDEASCSELAVWIRIPTTKVI